VTIALRPYQAEFVEAVEDGVRREVKNQLGVLPTGGGKTIVFSEIARRRADKPILILAHRDELLQQARDKLISVAPELAMSTGLVKAGANDVRAQIVIASIQTLARQSRREQLPPEFGTVIVDEAHHIVADSYRAVLDWVDYELMLGVTATAERADGKELEDHFDELVYAKSIESMVEEGYLCAPRGKRITVDVDLGAVKKSHGDFQSEALADALEEAGTPSEVLASYLEHGEGRKTLIFAPTVAMAHHMAEVFRGAGVAAEAVDGKTPTEERHGILQRLHTGETQVVANVGVLTEGFDEPSIACIIIAAPTKSRVKYTQIVGRGLRLHPGKSDCLILDVAGASDDKSIQSLPALFGLKSLLDGEDVVLAQERERREEREAGERQEAADAQSERRRRNAESIQFFSRDRMHWTTVGDRWTIPLNKAETLVLWPRSDERFDVLLLKVEKLGRKENRSFRFLARGLDLGYAMGTAEETIRKHGNRLLADSKAAWREDAPSEGQSRYLHRLRLPVPETKGEAADLLTEHTMAEQLEAVEVALQEREGVRDPVAA
jgi:superfamily II DNA or RNA helicase